MDDLISREKAISTAHSMRKVCDTENCDDYHDLIVAALTDLPPSEVVRCRECRYRYNDVENTGYNICVLGHNKGQSGEWYCFDGEKHDGA